MLHNHVPVPGPRRGALVGATCNEGRVGEAAATATAAAGKSSADLLFLQSLDAKIKELTEAGRIPISSAASQASAASERNAQTPTTTPELRQSSPLGDSPLIDSTQTVRPLSSLELEACE